VAFDIMRTKSLKRAVEYLIACNILTPSPRDVASFLRLHQSKIDPSALGEYLGEGGIDGRDVEYWNLIRFNYVRAISFVGMNVEQGLRHFLTNCGFRLPGEAQRIDRIISTFSQCYWEDNAGDHNRCPFQDQDTVFLISFAIIMLNTDLHKSQMGGTGGSSSGRSKQRKKMSRAEFINNLRDVNNSEEFSRDYLSTIYDSIEAHPIVIYHQLNDSRHGKTAAKDSVYISGVAPVSSDGNDLTAMIKSLIRSVKPSQELLRGLAIHEHPFHDISSYEHGKASGDSRSVVPKDLVWTALRYTWHHFLSIVNSTLETAHLDPKGLESCLDVLKYSICATICLNMTMESSAFITQLSRVKFFNQNRGIDESDNRAGRDAYRNDEWFDELEKACTEPSDDACKIQAVDQVSGMIDDLRSSLQIDSRQKKEMAHVSRRIRNGEILLNDPTRFFIREGDLTKRGNRTGRSVKYHFFLFSDMLVYAHKSSSSGEYKTHEELPLHLMKITDYALDGMTGHSRMKGSFLIQHPRKSFLVAAPSGELKNSWMRDINSAIKKDVERKAQMEGARLASAVKGTPVA